MLIYSQRLVSWINWWDARKYHMFPAFRWLGYSNVTLAESGNSTLKWHMQLWLLEAAHDDTSTMLTQIHEYKSFLTQQTSSSSRGPCSLTHERANIATQIYVAKAYVTEFNNKDACSAALQENANPQVFVPCSGTRHRPVKTKTGIEGHLCKKRNKRNHLWKKYSHRPCTSNKRSRSYSGRERNWLFSSMFPCTPSRKFPRGCAHGCFRYKKMSWL